MTKQIQTCGSFIENDNHYTFSIAFGDGPCMSLDGLTKDDIMEIASCALCMLPEEDYRTLLSQESDLN